MKATIQFKPMAVSLMVLLFVSYVLCIAGDLLFGWTMYTAWQPLLPGFIWPLTGTGFLIGLVWLVGYSVYITALVAVPYNFFVRQASSA